MAQAALAGFPGHREIDHGRRRRHAFESRTPAQVSSVGGGGAWSRGQRLRFRELEIAIGAAIPIFVPSLVWLRLLGYLLLVGLLAPVSNNISRLQGKPGG